MSGAMIAGDRRPILVGEANPYGAVPDFALYPLPSTSAGGRLCRLVMKLDVGDYLRRFDRRNLCRARWSMPEARETARAIGAEAEGRKVVLLGARVCKAFGVEFEPFTARAQSDCGLIILPHPSGLSRFWNEPGAAERARALLVKSGVL